VVVPGTSDTIAACWPQNAFSSEDLPLFILPKKPICSRFALGVSFRFDMIFPQLLIKKAGKEAFPAFA